MESVMSDNTSYVTFPLTTSFNDDVTLTNVTMSRNMTTDGASAVNDAIELNIYSILYMCIGSCGILGNLIVVLVMCSSREQRSKQTNIFIIDQSLIDSIASATMVAHSTSKYYSAGYVGILGLLRCKLWTNKWFMWHMFVTSTYNLVFLTLERYVHIIYPFKYQAAFNRKVVSIMILAAWAVPFTYKSPLFIHTTVVRDEVCYVMVDWPHPAVQSFWGILTALLQYFIPLAVMAFCYYRMIVVITKKPFSGSTPEGNSGETKKDRATTLRDEKMARASRNILKTLIFVCSAFAICWINNQVYFLMFNVGYPADFNGPYFHFTVIMVFLNCCINPFIYTLQYHPFQQQAQKLFCCCFKSNTAPPHRANATRSLEQSKSIGGSASTLNSNI